MKRGFSRRPSNILTPLLGTLGALVLPEFPGGAGEPGAAFGPLVFPGGVAGGFKPIIESAEESVGMTKVEVKLNDESKSKAYPAGQAYILITLKKLIFYIVIPSGSPPWSCLF